jgi:Protein of unknown function (DUF2591)
MKFDTVNLDGIALNYAVAKAAGWQDKKPNEALEKNDLPDFISSWQLAGHILEEEVIQIIPYTSPHGVDRWRADHRHPFKSAGSFAYGKTPLVAAMRCFAQEKLGFKVELPAEIQPPPPKSALLVRRMSL